METNSLDSVYRKYVNDIYRYLRSLCHDEHAAEDLLQETFYRAYLHLDDCKDDKVKPWLFRVAYNAFIDYLRKESRSSVYGTDYFHRLADSETPETAMIRQEIWTEIGQLVAGLPDNQRHAILLHDFHQLSYQEAADIMGIRLSHFKILLFRARQKLREYEEWRNPDERGV